MATYDVKESCNKCGGKNEVKPNDTEDGFVNEAFTKCIDCGFEDYWAHGFFESSQYIESKCRKDS